MITEKGYIKTLMQMLEKPGMYRIQRVEDIDIFIRAEIIFNRNKIVEDWCSKFSRFVVKRVDKNLKNFDWCKVIRLYSGSDSHSIELFKQLFLEFIESKL